MAEAACEPTVFDGLNGLESVAAAARGDVAREPALNQVTQELPASAKGKGGKSFRASVPADQMRVLNAVFAGFYGGAGSGFSFDLAGVTRTDNAAWHAAGPGALSLNRGFPS